MRTAKAERRLRDRLREEGLLTDEDDIGLSPSEERALRAEKRAAWRAARLKVRIINFVVASIIIFLIFAVFGTRCNSSSNGYKIYDRHGGNRGSPRAQFSG